MIELRWLVSPRNDVDRVLQYRTLEYIIVNGCFAPTGQRTRTIEWGEWKNVPEEQYAAEDGGKK